MNLLRRIKLARAAAGLNDGVDLPSLVFLTDDDRLADPVPAIAALPPGTLVILRARRMLRRNELAERIGRIAAQRRLFWLVSDDPGLALGAGADGVHFPESRISCLGYWRARRPHWLITAAAHSLRAAMQAHLAGANAALVGPVFVTKSHVNRAPLGAMRLRLMAQHSPLPLYALGGIDAENAARLTGAKLAGFACVGALAA